MDHAATSPLRDTARQALIESWDALNPGGQYSSGRHARKLLEESREKIAHTLGCEPIEVIFTGSGTEADNLAVQGLFGARATESAHTVWVGAVEHPAVLEPAKALKDTPISDGSGAVRVSGGVVKEIAVDRTGHYLIPELNSDTDVLVAAQWANNETGAVHPIQEISRACNDAGVAWHVDAVQAVGHIPVHFADSGATTLAASAHKFGGPRSTGLLLCKRSAKLAPIIRGGGQERSIRPGTLNVAGAVATAAALEEACAQMESEHKRLSALRDDLIGFIGSRFNGVRIHTQQPALPGHIHVSFPGCEGDSLIMLLDAAGFECSTGSACAAGVNRVSHVVMAMDVDPRLARGTLRFTLGTATGCEDIEKLKAALPRIVEQAQAAGLA